MQMYNRKYFEHCVKKETFWGKIIFQTKEQQRHFTMSFECMPENFKRTYPIAQCIID